MRDFLLILKMPLRAKSLLRKFLIWKYKHISERQFVYMLSILVGFLAGMGTVLLKNLTYYIRYFFNLYIFKDLLTFSYRIFLKFREIA